VRIPVDHQSVVREAYVDMFFIALDEVDWLTVCLEGPGREVMQKILVVLEYCSSLLRWRVEV
jgi:hypothetical protein